PRSQAPQVATRPLHPRARRGPTRGRCPRARRRARSAPDCGGTADRRPAGAPAGPALAPGTPRPHCGRRMRCRPPSGATRARGTRCGRGRGEGRPRRAGWSWTFRTRYRRAGPRPPAGPDPDDLAASGFAVRRRAAEEPIAERSEQEPAEAQRRPARQLFVALREPSVAVTVWVWPLRWISIVSGSPAFLPWIALRRSAELFTFLPSPLVITSPSLRRAFSAPEPDETVSTSRPLLTVTSNC